MPRTLTAKPAVRRTNRIVKLPKVARSRATQINPQIREQMQTARRAVKTPRAHQQAQKETPRQTRSVIARAANQSQKRSTRIVASKRRQLIRKANKKGPKILYKGNELDESAKSKIKNLRGIGKGKLLAIIGNGPSVLDVDLQQLKDHESIDIMSINKPDKRIWPTTYWLFCDNSQYRRHEDLWKQYSGKLLNTTAIKNRKSNSVIIKNLGGMGFSQDLVDGFHIGRSSTYAAMQAALWLEYDHIYIFGCDMASKIVNGKELLHFYGTNPDVSPQNRKTRFDQEAKYYSYAADKLASHIRRRYTFCSSLLKYAFANKFNKMDHEEAVYKILNHAKELEVSHGRTTETVCAASSNEEENS